MWCVFYAAFAGPLRSHLGDANSLGELRRVITRSCRRRMYLRTETRKAASIDGGDEPRRTATIAVVFLAKL